MEGKKPVVFHSGNIADTKAKEKREIFVKVEEKKTLKQSAEEFQKKFAEAKAHAAESRAKIENPGADANGVIRSGKSVNINWKLVRKIAIPAVILGGIGLAVYLNWGAIYHEFFEVSEERAYELLGSDPERAATMFESIIVNEADSSTRAKKSIWYADNLFKSCSSEEGMNCSGKILETIFKLSEISENASPSRLSALYMSTYYAQKGNTTEAEKWTATAESRYVEGEGYGEG